MIRAVIFDVDGTLVDTTAMHASAWYESFEYFGRIFPIEKIRSQIGKGGDQLKPVFLSENELAAFGSDLDRYRREHWKRNYLHRVKAFPKVRELFQRIRNDGKSIALATSSHEEDLVVYENAAHIGDLVDGKVTASNVAHSKPAPDVFLVALEQLDLMSSKEAIVVGDSPHDAAAATATGLLMIGVRTGGYSDKELLMAGVREIYNDPSDLLDHYDSSLLA
ncbi:MAG TPA: HAD family phosphatase [Candidatus Kapabacteria bacterium]|jgi:HAD superfamily hydrolase (TIGR01509 family)|nr:HAD family phosphatase [Candidatus Kapabacteria bacterium]